MRKLLVITALLLFSGVAFGQTLKNGAIIEIHHINLNLNPDATMNQWLDFALNEYLPVWETHYKGIKSLVVKGTVVMKRIKLAGSTVLILRNLEQSTLKMKVFLY